MLTKTFKCLRETNFNFNFLLIRLFSTKNSTLSQLIQNPSLIQSQYQNPSPDSQAIASTFRDWFNTSKNPNFDRFFEVLNSTNDSDLGKVELGIAKLNETVVLDVLRYKSSDALSCLKFFDWCGRQCGFRHTRGTYIAIFKIMSREKCNSLMLGLLDEFSKDKSVYRGRFVDTLVVGYALAGKVDVALQLFGKMRFQGIDLNKVTYHVLLDALVDVGRFDMFKVILDQIRARGHGNDVTDTIVVKSMCKQGRLREAEKYVRDMVKKGKKVSGRLFGDLVDCLCKEKMFSRAGELLHEFGGKCGVVSDQAYGIWIRNLVHAEKLDSALEFVNEKKSIEGYIPDVYRYNTLISKLLKEDRLQEVCDLFMDMKESKIAPDKMTMDAVFCFFCKAGMMDVVFELYKRSSEFGLTPHSLVCNYIVNTLSGDGSTNEAYELLKSSMSQGYFPGSSTLSILADALCREGKLDKMKELIMFALEHKFKPAKSTYEKFIRALCQARRVEDGYLIHQELNRLNETVSETTYSYLISGFNETGRGDVAGTLLIEMQEKGHKPSPRLFKAVMRSVGEIEDDKYFLQLLEMQLSRYGHDVDTYNYFIHGAGHAGKAELGQSVFEMMEKNGLVPSLNSDIFMLQCFLKSDRISDAINFFGDIPRRRRLGTKLYDTMVVGLCKAGKADFAATFFREAKNNRQTLSLCSYEELIKVYCSDNKFDQAIIIINDLEKADRKISTFIGNCLLFYSMQSGDLYRAWLQKRDVSKETPSSATLGQLVAAFSDHIRVDCKVEDLEEIIRKCFPLDLYTYNMLLRKLTINHIDKACQLFKRLCQKGIKPNQWTYDILVHGLYKHGRIAEGNLWEKEMHRQRYCQSESNPLS